ncbi:hypothetical protein CMI37_16530 [Candidatus Pacearchaeota archaeon]|nr:hypothetical protein [Candidatus Pacearchaeota archaeon]|tara:strand:- start:750 stop:1184 length:435 start_codon:yes stop_codon:yes gene_type:complete
MEKHNRFMAELRALLERYQAEFYVPDEGSGLRIEYDGELERLASPEQSVCDKSGNLDLTDDPEWDPISNELQVGAFLHCGLCLEEWRLHHAGKISPKGYCRQQAGWTKQGIQVWCNRHDVNILHVDFGGHRRRANTSRQKLEGE